jgi:tripartite-type tricarboxylate transporter receptor subunit TctC
VAKSAPDGYTILLIGLSTYTINASLYPKLPYDPHKDLTGLSVLAEAPYIFAVHPSLPVKNVKDLLALDKARPKELNFASGGTGTGPHLAMEILKDMTGLTMVHIPYKGAGPGMTDLMAGHVQVMMVNMIAGLPFARQGRLRAIAVSRARRSAAAPDLPSIAESGVPGFDTAGQHLIMIRSGTPRDIVARLNTELVKVLNQPDISKRLAHEGADVIGNKPDEAQSWVLAQNEKWAKVIRRLGLRAN